MSTDLKEAPAAPVIKDPKAALAALQGLLGGAAPANQHATLLGALDRELCRLHETIRVAPWWGRLRLHAALERIQSQISIIGWHMLEQTQAKAEKAEAAKEMK